MTALPTNDAHVEPLTRISQLRSRIALRYEWRRRTQWLTPLVITLFAALLRIPGIGHPAELAFDETYYAKDAWSLLQFGYEGTWADESNERFAAGDLSTLSAEGSFVVHPPLGKWIIALGMIAFGQHSPFGWRIATALLGVATVLLLFVVVRHLTRSLLAASIAALLLAIDGMSIAMSRVALLDGALTFFVLLALFFILKDRAAILPRVQQRYPNDPDLTWGPLFWRRPWLIAAGATLGAACAVKWSGLYALAVFGLYVVISDALARRRAGVAFWPMDAVSRQGLISFLLMVPTAFAVYLSSWTGWLLTTDGYNRTAGAHPLESLWIYHQSILNFHSGLASGHPYASPAWQWPLLIRPTAIWVNSDPNCGTDHCLAVISSIPNPLLWYAGIGAALYLCVRSALAAYRRTSVRWQDAVPLVGLCATYAPWLLIPGRTIFQFYTVSMMPFLVIAIVLALRDIAGHRADSFTRRRAGERWVLIFLGVSVAISAFFYPLAVGMSVPYEFWLIHNWLQSWI